MSMRSILVPWWGESTSTSQLDAALAIARRVEAHLDVVFVRPRSNDLETTLEPATQATGRASFEAWRERNGVPGHIVNQQIRVPFAKWSERTGSPEQFILRKGRLVDMIVLRFPALGDALDRPHDAALFESGHPVLLVPEHVEESLLSHVVVAWNGSLHSTRSVTGAMPLPRAAERVTVLTTADLGRQLGNQGSGGDGAGGNGPSGDTDLVDALSWHGVEAGHCQLDPNTSPVGKALLQEAGDLKATLLVMGAATRSRVSAAFLGGTTEHVFRNPPGIPVLMAH